MSDLDLVGGIAVVAAGSPRTVPGRIAATLTAALRRHATTRHIATDPAAGALAGPGDAAGGATLMWLGRECDLAVAVIWPGLRASWLRRFFAAANATSTPAAILYCSVPRSAARSWVRPLWEASVRPVDLVLTGNAVDAVRLRSRLGARGPVVQAHPALRFGGTAVGPGRLSGAPVTGYPAPAAWDALAARLTTFAATRSSALRDLAAMRDAATSAASRA